MKATSLPAYRGIHAGRDVVVAGSGPSLSRFPPEWFEGKIVIAVNDSIVKLGGRADYFLTSDGNTVNFDSWPIVRDGRFPIIAGRLGCSELFHLRGGLPESREVCFFEKHGGSVPSPQNVILDPASDSLVFGTTSPHCAVHFAIVLGARRVIVTGCDCQTSEGRTWYHEAGGEAPVSPVDAETAKRQGWHHANDGWLNESFNYWRAIAAANRQAPIQAWGGRLEGLFPKYAGD